MPIPQFGRPPSLGPGLVASRRCVRPGWDTRHLNERCNGRYAGCYQPEPTPPRLADQVIGASMSTYSRKRATFPLARVKMCTAP